MTVHTAQSPSADLTTVGIPMPNDFPRTSYEAIQEHCKTKMAPNTKLAKKLHEYSTAWNAVAYRFLAVSEHDEAFAAAITRSSHFDRYVQERELFNFFVAGLSTIETFIYGLYFLASIACQGGFPVDQPSIIKLTFTKEKFKRAFPTEAITSQLQALKKDPDLTQWCDVRNILAHRCAPGRIIHASIGGRETDPDDIWKLENIELELNSDTTGLRRKWLSKKLTQLLDDARIFVERNV